MPEDFDWRSDGHVGPAACRTAIEQLHSELELSGSGDATDQSTIPAGLRPGTGPFRSWRCRSGAAQLEKLRTSGYPKIALSDTLRAAFAASRFDPGDLVARPFPLRESSK
jgi:hypothetical protein